MKILVYGGNGYIGKILIEYLKKQSGVSIYYGSRIQNYNQLSREIIKINPGRIISTVGRTFYKDSTMCERQITSKSLDGHLLQNVSSNLFAPLLLARVSDENNIHYTYIGTGCIYNGDTFSEDDIPNFIKTEYAIIKGTTDQLLQTYKAILNIRIRMPINNDTSSHNFINKFL